MSAEHDEFVALMNKAKAQLRNARVSFISMTPQLMDKYLPSPKLNEESK